MLIFFYLLLLVFTFNTTRAHNPKYILSSKVLTHKDAILWCKSMSMELVSVQDRNKHLEIVDFLKNQGNWAWAPDTTYIILEDLHKVPYWTSGKFNKETNTWNWGNGDLISNYNWMPGIPLNYECVSIYNILNCPDLFWKDEDCNSLNRAICEDPNAIPQTTLHKDCFYISQDELSFYEALQFCQRLDMQLLSIRDHQKQNFVNLVLSNAGRALGVYNGKTWPEAFWTSGNNLVDNKTFEWIMGDPVQYTNWQELKENRPTCLLLITTDTNQWFNTRSCLNKYFFICEFANKIQNAWILPKVYYISDIKATYFRALKLCKLQGMKLVAIQDSDKNKALFNQIPTGKDLYWTSGSKIRNNEHLWIWHGSTRIHYTNYHSMSDFYELHELNCILVFKTADQIMWQIDYCENEHKFICETDFPLVNLYCSNH